MLFVPLKILLYLLYILDNAQQFYCTVKAENVDESCIQLEVQGELRFVGIDQNILMNFPLENEGWSELQHFVGLCEFQQHLHFATGKYQKFPL